MDSKQNQVNVNNNSTNTNGVLGKRKKSYGKKSAYLSKWLDKTINHIQETTPNINTYDSIPNPNINWSMNGSPLAAGYDPYRFNMYGCVSEPMSLPTLPSYYNPPLTPYCSEYRYIQSVKSMQAHRPRQRRRSENKAEEFEPNGTPNCTLNSANFMLPKNYSDSQDFASLPPIITSVGDTMSTSDTHMNDKEDAANARRYSDPCVQGLPDVAKPAQAEVDSVSESSSDASGSQVGSRLLSCLLDQITTLKLTNERLNSDLMETRAELNNMRAQSCLWQKGSSPKFAAANHLNNNGVVGGAYSPGFLTDLVREVRDAARMREEAMYSRVHAMVLERTDSALAASELKFTEKTLEEIKSSLRVAEADKRRMMDRIMKIEDELRSLKLANEINTDNGLQNGSIENPETERTRLRKEVTDMRKAKEKAEEHSLKLERLVTQLRSKFNGLQLSPNGPESLPSEHEHDGNARTRRTSVNSNTTVVFGPVTDL